MRTNFMKRLLILALAVALVAPATAAAATPEHRRAVAWRTVTADCKRYIGCSRIVNFYTKYTTTGAFGTAERDTFYFSFRTRNCGPKVVKFVYTDPWVFPDHISYTKSRC